MIYRHRTLLIAIASAVLLVAMVAPASAAPGYETISLQFTSVNVPGCSMFAPTTDFGIEVAYDSPVNLDYNVSVLSGPAGTSGSQSGSFPAGTVPNGLFLLTLNTAATPVGWSITIQMDGSAGGIPVTTATARIDCTAGNQFLITPLSFANVYQAASVAGCDSYLPLTANSVVGTFTQTTPVYGQPSADSASNVVIEAGKSYWVLGVDASGGYYRVIIGCSLVWVPVATVGPNYDDVWGGRPLPTNVVS
ncbi:MAG: hypothetical protein JNL34_09275 [Anaerolineae bacterium]|nr:hypothetical protein [Anaerolineae bacterium]